MENKRYILGFGHKRQRGKDTACDYIVETTKSSLLFKKDSFANSLKTGIGQGVFGLTEEQLTSPILKKKPDPFWGITPREILQKAGTEAMRLIFGDDIWVNTLKKRIFSQDCHFCISDVRFINEANTIKELGGLLIRIDRDIPFDEKSDNHASEIDLDVYDDWDYILDNNGSFEYLYSQIDSILRGLECGL